MSLSPIMRDYLVRFQQTAMRETGRRPVTFLRAPMDESLLLPGCLRPGYACWQPMPWNGEAPLGPKADHFHESIRQYVSLCQFLEIHFRLPVTRAGSPLSFLYGRVFESCKNTLTAPPDRAFEEALWLAQQDASAPAAYCMAVTCDDGEPLMLMLRASDGQAFIRHAAGEARVLDLRLGLDRLLPRLQFVYDI